MLKQGPYLWTAVGQNRYRKNCAKLPGLNKVKRGT
jgi:hypothetical protein